MYQYNLGQNPWMRMWMHVLLFSPKTTTQPSAYIIHFTTSVSENRCWVTERDEQAEEKMWKNKPEKEKLQDRQKCRGHKMRVHDKKSIHNSSNYPPPPLTAAGLQPSLSSTPCSSGSFLGLEMVTCRWKSRWSTSGSSVNCRSGSIVVELTRWCFCSLSIISVNQFMLFSVITTFLLTLDSYLLSYIMLFSYSDRASEGLFVWRPVFTRLGFTWPVLIPYVPPAPSPERQVVRGSGPPGFSWIIIGWKLSTIHKHMYSLYACSAFTIITYLLIPCMIKIMKGL